MKLKTFYDLLTRKRDLRSLKILNELFGKKCLFIEKPHRYLKEIERYLSKNSVNEIFILTPENYEDMIKKEFPNTSKESFEKAVDKVLKLSRSKNIKIILHLHLNKNPETLPFKEKLDRTKKALNYLVQKKVKIDEIGYGWWSTSHKDKELLDICNKLGLKLSKRRFHVYDYWLNSTTNIYHAPTSFFKFLKNL